MTAGFDIIGDVHGHAELLITLLQKLGYREDSGWSHPEGRRAVFVGDVIDRGPFQLETLRIVRGMTERGSAFCMLGNHEYNAVCRRLGKRALAAKDPHVSFLEEMARANPLYEETLAWFLTLPMWLDLGEIRVVHACWDPKSFALIEAEGAGPRLTEDMVLKAHAKGKRKGELTPGQILHDALETVLKGPELPLPEVNGRQLSFDDKSGTVRTRIRTRWWMKDAGTLREAAFMAEAGLIPPLPIADDIFVHAPEKPTFIGHYWMRESMGVAPLAPSLCCLDYSAGRGGPLAAYRWNEGDAGIAEDRFVLARPAEAAGLLEAMKAQVRV